MYDAAFSCSIVNYDPWLAEGLIKLFAIDLSDAEYGIVTMACTSIEV
jgi:hypothetical protein